MVTEREFLEVKQKERLKKYQDTIQEMLDKQKQEDQGSKHDQ